jgi:Fanconi anemia group M protein
VVIDLSTKNKYINHPLIIPNKIEEREYQKNITKETIQDSSLVVLPTGLGKTIISLYTIAERLHNIGGKALILSPTKPLVEQHAQFFKETLNLSSDEIIALTGSISPDKRINVWKSSKLIISTPQIIQNDLLSKRIDLSDVCHITFDEAHRAVGNYAYTLIAQKYMDQCTTPHMIGITASPGGTTEKITEVRESLGIENIIVRSEDDMDVKPYIKKKNIQWYKIDLPTDLKAIRSKLIAFRRDRIEIANSLGLSLSINASKRDILEANGKLQGEIKSGNAESSTYTIISVLAEVMKINHAIELIETQGIQPLKKYLDKLYSEGTSSKGSKASKRIAEDEMFKFVYNRARTCTTEHPKFEKMRNVVCNTVKYNKNAKMIVFTNYRDTAKQVSDYLEKLDGIKPIRFVGQAHKKNDRGLSQKEQAEIIQQFKNNDYNVLVATSVAEEGLDIPATDLVLFYEPVPSEIRSIQRSGRTGRQQDGQVIVLITKDTRDEGYYWSSINKEKRMKQTLKNLKLTCSNNKPKQNQSNLSTFTKKQPSEQITHKKSNDRIPKIIVDTRETKSGVPGNLDNMDVELDIKTLEIGDYVVSDDTAIERKEVSDFVSSLIGNGEDKQKIFGQLSDLSKEYNNPILIIEGGDINTVSSNINPNAIHGALLSMSIDMGITIMYTRDKQDTANLIRILATREQFERNKSVNAHGKKSSRSVPEQQEYLISAIDGVGATSAKNLLNHFGSIANIINASEKDLMKVDLVGKSTAAKIKNISNVEYSN